MKIVIRVLTFMVICMPISLFAQLNGTITDKSTGEKISGAIVTIESSYAYSLTDANGSFSFSHLDEKNVILHVHHIAYELLTQAITLPYSDVKLQLQPG